MMENNIRQQLEELPEEIIIRELLDEQRADTYLSSTENHEPKDLY